MFCVVSNLKESYFCTNIMINKELKADWFKDWFDSPFYHILYQNRDEEEANFFIHNLVNYLELKPKLKVLDLACGKGRHAYFLSQYNLNVFGADLAENSISEASKMEQENLRFFVHDMRNKLPIQSFDFIFNLFTSFGYFDHEDENSKVLDSIYQALNEKGTLVIDFMNAQKVIANLVTDEQKVCANTTFKINRWVDGKHIFKQICFTNEGEEKTYVERVQALLYEDFEKLLLKAGFELKATFGNYKLEPFYADKSDRLILIAQKK
jgi:SAM-dependent methyltransferase